MTPPSPPLSTGRGVSFVLCLFFSCPGPVVATGLLGLDGCVCVMVPGCDPAAPTPWMECDSVRVWASGAKAADRVRRDVESQDRRLGHRELLKQEVGVACTSHCH